MPHYPLKQRLYEVSDSSLNCLSKAKFVHITGEWYEDEKHVMHSCYGVADMSCSSQWASEANQYTYGVERSLSYHSIYLGVDMRKCSTSKNDDDDYLLGIEKEDFEYYADDDAEAVEDDTFLALLYEDDDKATAATRV